MVELGRARTFGEAMPTRVQAHDMVSREGWLSFTPEPFWRVVLDRCKLEAFSAGATIYSVGDPPGGMFGLLRGSFALSIAPGERGPISRISRDQARGSARLRPSPASLRRIGLAVTRDSKLLHLPLHGICEIVAADPGAWRFFGPRGDRALRRGYWRRGRPPDPRSRQAERRGALAPLRPPVPDAARFVRRSRSTSARKISPR